MIVGIVLGSVFLVVLFLGVIYLSITIKTGKIELEVEKIIKNKIGETYVWNNSNLYNELKNNLITKIVDKKIHGKSFKITYKNNDLKIMNEIDQEIDKFLNLDIPKQSEVGDVIFETVETKIT